ncbi:hypothetical protein L965_192 [Leuconostoc pseudomesenteroides PS12]|nr:hypothetical protein L964_1756 [Leuconostoc pseudomesenteroides 1159]KDA50333.1 hypothetical protein L965_192 [Leuconostoc pseudomesenteroides PS12]CCJ67387.1 hypothetical protein Q5C_08480 [Leuconostoc pseudomesenteroides 4882]
MDNITISIAFWVTIKDCSTDKYGFFAKVLTIKLAITAADSAIVILTGQ